MSPAGGRRSGVREMTRASRLTDRDAYLLCARAYLAESARRGRTDFAWLLLRWAANARRRAAATRPQMELFCVGENVP